MKEERANDDLLIVRLMTGKLLRQEHGFEDAPQAADYRLIEERGFSKGRELAVDVRLAPRLTVDVGHTWRQGGDMGLSTLADTAEWLADSIARLHVGREEVAAMLSEVRAAVRREVVKARRCGLQYRVVAMRARGPHQLGDGTTAVEVAIERLGESLRPQVTLFEGIEAREVIERFGIWDEDQTNRAVYRSLLDRHNSTGMIDGVVVNALREAGHDVGQVLRRLDTEQDWIVDVGDRAGSHFRLYWKEGHVCSHLRFDENASWREGMLTFRSMPAGMAHVRGKRLQDVALFPPLTANPVIQSTFGDKGSSEWLACKSDMLHFDAASGHLWAA